jgi:hypothetical protein
MLVVRRNFEEKENIHVHVLNHTVDDRRREKVQLAGENQAGFNPIPVLRKLPAHLRHFVKDGMELRFLTDKTRRKFLQAIRVDSRSVINMRQEAEPQAQENTSGVVLKMTVYAISENNTDIEILGEKFEIEVTASGVGVTCVSE